MHRLTPSSHCPRALHALRAFRPARALRGLGVAAGAALLACASPPAPTDEVGIAVGALPGRPGYEQVVRGVTLAVARLNAEGDTRFRVVLPADSAASVVAVAAAHRANPSVMGVVGHPESGATQVAIPVYADVGDGGRNAVVAISPTASSPTLSGISPWFYRVAPSDAAGARDVARFAWDTLRVGIAAVVYRNDAYGRDWAAAFTEAWTARGGTVLIRDPYLAGQTDWDVYAAHVAREDPDLVLFPGDTEDAVPFLRALRAAGARAGFIGGDGTEGLAGLPEFAGARYVTFFHAEVATGAEAQRFLSAWHTAHSEPPDGFAALAYDAALAIGAAWRAAPEKSRAGVRDALETLTLEGAGGRVAFARATHDVIGRSVVVRTVGPDAPPSGRQP
jgi:branched-chain amino acid transport system substrate-binding protein